jgi:hypothetical protein
MTTPTKTAKRPLLTYFAVMASTTALVLGLLGCMLYLLLWFTLTPHEQFGIVAGMPVSGLAREKLLVPKLINYLSLVLCFAAFVLGTVAMILEDKNLWAEVSLGAAGVVLALLLLFWVWTMTRSTENYVPKLNESEKQSQPVGW